MSKRHSLILLAACVLFVFLFYPARLYFLSDDWDSLLFSLQPSNILHSFRPLSDASLWLDHAFWGMDGSGFHLTNYVLHFACVFCVYQFSKQLFLLWYSDEFSANFSLIGSLFFLFYPFHSEAIFWIVGRGAILCTLFGLLSLIFFIKRESNLSNYLLSLFFFAAALLSYEEAWILPAIITILSFLYSSQSKKRQGLFVLIFWIVFLVYLVGRFYFTQDVIGTPYGSERMLNFNIFFLARNFAAFVFRSFVVPLQSSVLFASICVLVALTLLVLIFLYRKSIGFVLLLCAIFFLLSLIPVLPLGINTHNTESERFLYFPSAFFVLLLVLFFRVVFEQQYRIIYFLVIAGMIPLWLSYDSFLLGSHVSKQTALAIAKMSATDTLFCRQLPGQYKGAFIFRNGFASMVRLVKKDSVQAISILSTSELFQPNQNYDIEFDTVYNKLHEGSFQKDNLHIRWQESGLTISRKPFTK